MYLQVSKQSRLNTRVRIGVDQQPHTVRTVTLCVRRRQIPATLALRPHRLRLVSAGQGRLDGRCKRADYLGSHVEYLVESAWGELLVFGPVEAGSPERGDAVGLAFEAGDAMVLGR